MTIKAIIFDMDGVLLDSMPMHLKVWEEIFKKRKLDFSLKIFEKYNGTSTFDIAVSLIKEYNLNDAPEEIVNEKHDKEAKLEDEMLELFPDTLKVLELLKDDDYKIGIATSAMERTVDYVKERFKLDKFVDVFVEAKDVKNTKPSPDIFLLAAEKLGVEPKNCVVIEDAVNGIIAAKKAEMISVAITNTFKKEVFIDADFVIDNLFELREVLSEVDLLL